MAFDTISMLSWQESKKKKSVFPKMSICSFKSWLSSEVLTSVPTEQRSGQHLRGILSGEDHHHHRLHRQRLQSFYHDHVQAGGGSSNSDNASH